MTLEDADFRIRFPQLLRRSRLDAQLSIRELARRTGIDPTHLSRIERGLVPPPAGPRLAAIIRELPRSPLAAKIRIWTVNMWKRAVWESADQTRQLLFGISQEDLADSGWNSQVLRILKRCMTTLQSQGKRNRRDAK
jgi:predicted transcriptional regulator